MKLLFSLVIALAVALSAVPAPASAKTVRTKCDDDKLLTSYSAKYHAVKHRHGTRAPGRNIRKWGITTKRKSTCSQIRKSRDTLARMLIVPKPAAHLVTTGRPYSPPAQIATVQAPAGGTLSKIAACESGGNPAAVSPSGQYRGKYQFSRSTWAAMGGSGDPAAAPEAEQDQRAAKLYATAGAGQWPVCGR